MGEIQVSRAAAVLLLAGLAAGAAHRAARAADTVDLQVLPRDRVQGTLRPADERESYYVAGLRGSKVKAVVKRTGGSAGPTPTLELLDAAGVTSLATGTPGSGRATLKSYVLEATAGVRFRVAGDLVNDGDYQLDLTTTPRSKWDGRSEGDLAPGAEATFAFAAPRGAKVSVKVTRSGRAALVPLVLALEGPHGELYAGDAVSRPTSDSIGVADLPSDGEWTLRFRNDGDVAGAWKASARLSHAKYARRTVDLRDDALAGDFAGLQSVVGRIADPGADTVIDGPEGLGLDGVSILVPEGAVTLPTLVSISQADEFFVDDDANGAGTTATFSPSGTVFSVAATMTLPYDPSSFDDPATELSIVVLNPETGELETIFPTSVDTANHIATFPATHFSRFQPVSRRPRPFRGSFVDVGLSGEALPDFSGSFGMSFNQIDATTGPRTPRPIERDVEGQRIVWTRTKAGDDADFDATVGSGKQFGIASALTNTSVQLQVGPDDLTVRRGRDPRVYANLDADSTGVTVHFVLHRPPGRPTAGNLAGKWHGAVLEFGGSRAEPAGVDLTVADQRFELDVSATGEATATASVASTWRQRFPLTSWNRTVSKKAPKRGTLLPTKEAAALTMRLGFDDSLDGVALFPVIGGDALIGVARRRDAPTQGPATAAFSRLVLLVRADTDAAATDLAGQFLTTAFALLLDDHAGAPSTLGFETTAAVRSHDELRFGLGARVAARHDDAGIAGVATQQGVTGTFTFALSRDGIYRVTGAPVGGFAAAGHPILLFSSDLPARTSIGVGTLAKPVDLGKVP